MSPDVLITNSAGVRPAHEAVKIEGKSVFSALPAGPAERRLALSVVLVSAAVFLALLPFAKIALPQVWAFIPIYQSALVVNDVITAVLLFGQFAISRSRPLLLLGAAFLFTAFMAVAHALSFPGLLAPAGVIGGGAQTTAWLYFLWHGAFPLLVIGYALIKDEAQDAARVRGSVGAAIAWAAGAAFAIAWGITLVTTVGHDLLPVIMSGNSDLAGKYVVAWGACLLCAAASVLLWQRKPHSVLDIWLMVVMCAWVFDVALSGVFNSGRFSLGFYAGRIYGLLAASFVLVILLLEHGRLYARLFEAQESERDLAHETLMRQAERLRILHDIDSAAAADEAPKAIADAVIGPLRELLGVPRAIVNLFDLEAGEVEWLAAAGRRRTHTGPGVRYSIRLMGDLEALKQGEPQWVDTRKLPPGPEVDALLGSGVDAYMVMPMIAGGELIGALSFGGEQANFTEDQMSIARESATQLAIAITQARLLERIREQAGELEHRVRERTTELQAANRELESFSYSVSHDLRGPLRAIDGFSLMLEEDHADKLDEEGRRLISVVRASAANMAKLIDDLLAFSRIGKKPLSVSATDMQALALEVVEDLSPAHPKARIEVEALPQASVDRALMKQVWANLVGNALKYSSRKDDPKVEIGGATQGAENVYWVRDNGAGFDMKYAGKLFGVFQRLHGTDEFEGTGVGLAIVQRVVSRHGGRIWAEAGVGQGACFRFAFPAPHAERAA